MVTRMVARGAWMGMSLALCLGAFEANAADTTATVASKTVRAAASNPLTPVVTPEAKAAREKIMQVEKVAQDVSTKRDSSYLNEARERDKKRREEEAALKSRRVAVSDSALEGKEILNIGKDQ